MSQHKCVGRADHLCECRIGRNHTSDEHARDIAKRDTERESQDSSKGATS